jgi:hypothetical protein
MGQVWVVEPVGMPGAQRALKALPLVDDPLLRERFRREADLLARVEGHPNLARVHDAGETDGRPWVVVGLIEGEDLGRRVARGGPLPWREAVGLVIQVARGLAHVHRHGVLHRDVKPSNIVVGQDGRAVLVDFGVAWADDLGALTRTGLVVGTPAYFSPEQARGEPLDARSDVHALGATLFELLTGRPPYAEGPSPADTLRRIIDHPAPSARALAPVVPPAVDAAIARALAKHRDQRLDDATAFAALLTAALDEGSPRPAARRPPPALVGVALGALGGVVILGGVAVAVRPTPPATATTDGPPPGPTATVSPTSPPREALDPDGAELVDLLERGEATAALGKLHRRRSATLGPSAGPVEEAARRLALRPARSGPATVEALRALARARALSPSPLPGGRELVDALLRRIDGDAVAALAAGPATRDDLAELIEALAATGLRPQDPAMAERVVDRLYELHHSGRMGAEPYTRTLLAAVQLDIDLQADHLRSFAPPPGARGYAVELLSIRSRLYDSSGRGDDARWNEALVDLRALLASRADAMGPITRARAVCVAAPLRAGEEALRPWLPRLEQGRRDDPRNPAVAMVLAGALEVVGRDEEARRIQREAFEAARAQSDRVTFKGWERVLFYQSGVRLLLRLGLVDEARGRLREMTPFAPPEVLETLRDEVAARHDR